MGVSGTWGLRFDCGELRVLTRATFKSHGLILQQIYQGCRVCQKLGATLSSGLGSLNKEQKAPSPIILISSPLVPGLVNCPDGSHHNENGQANQGFHLLLQNEIGS